MEFNGWLLIDKVSIVCKGRYKKDVQGFVLDIGNKKQLETALSWAKGYDYMAKEPDILEFDNTGFKLEFFDSANGSNAGGKLSFWNCRLTKDGKSFIVGINADLLLKLILNSHIVNGKVQEDVFFVKNKSNLGVIHNKMSEYTEALKDMNLKSHVKSNKTADFKLGYNYYTATLDNTLLGRVYDWFEEVLETRGRDKYIIGYKVRKQPLEKYIFHDTALLKERMKELQVYTLNDLVEKELKDIQNAIKKDVYCYLKVELAGINTIINKLPKRAEGCKVIDCTDLSTELFNSYLEAYAILKGADYKKSGRYPEYRLGLYRYSAHNTKRIDVPEDLKKYLMS